jgi:transcription elongation factor Elf1
MITIRLFDTQEKAQHFRGALETAGVPVQLLLENGGEERASVLLNFQIQVAESDIHRVREILEKEHVGTLPSERSQECPYCGSQRVEAATPLHQRTIRFIVRLLVSKRREQTSFSRCRNCSQYWEVKSERNSLSDSSIALKELQSVVSHGSS